MPSPALPARPAAPAARRPGARRRRSQRRLARISRLLAWLLSAWLGGTGLAWAQVAPGALPAGAHVVTGAGQLVYSPNLLVVNQGSRQLGLDWQSFNIGSGSMVEFRQPGADAVALNRVLGNGASEIYGRLKANGQVFLTNPNGILFAPGAKVDVGGLVASTLDLSQQDFAAGIYAFGGDSRASVVNQGSLRASAGGYLALFGKDVSNQGQMTVDAGSVVLASGRAATVSISGSGLISAVVDPGLVAGSVANAGSIAADGGVVTLSAHSARDIAASLVNNTGIVRANALVERGGEIWITGDQVATSGSLAATAPAGGQGGRIMVLADLKQGSAQVAGTLDAGAGAGGQGGFIETSGARVKIAEGTQVQAGSRGGQAGTWLIDPTDFTIAASGGDLTGAGLSGTLNNSTTNVVILSTQGAGGTAGNVNVNDAVTWSSAATLTLNAQNNVNINAPITSSGAGVLSLEVGQAAVAAGNTSTWNIAAPVNLAAGANRLRTRIGNNGTVVQYESVTTLARLQELDGNATVLAGNYVLGADIDATSTASGLGFNPIGNETTFSTAQAFSGRFDGLGHTITGLTVNRPASNFTGLFAATNNATIANLTLAGGVMTGSQYVGGVVGRAEGSTTLTNVRSGAAVNAVDDSSSGVYAGGLVGYIAGTGTGGIARSSASGVVTADTNTSVSHAGGAVGQQAAGFLTDVSASGNVTATQRTANGGTSSFDAGGLVGQFTGTSITRGTATGNVAGYANVGGLAGSASATGSISASRAEGTVALTGSGDAGGLIGQALGTGSLSDSIAVGNVTTTAGTGNVGGLVGLYQMGGALTRGEANGSVSGGNVTGGLVGYFNSSAALATGTSRGATVSGTTWVGGLVGYGEGTSITDSTAIANVTGTTNGGSGGLAGRTAGSVLRSSASGNVTGGSGSALGGLVGIAQGTGSMSTVSASGNVTSTAVNNDNVGGLVGEFSLPGGLSGADASGNVSGGRLTGGLVGYYNTSGTLSGGTARNATVSGGDYTGGLVGYAQAGAITGSSATANVTGTSNAGGLVARTAGSVSSSSASGSVTATTTAAGLVALAEGAGAYTDVSASGNVTTANGNGYVGGLLGYVTASGGVLRGTATGTVSGGRYTGGAIGFFSTSGNLANLRAEGAVSGAVDVGGLIGYASGSGSLADAVALGNVTAAGGGGSAGGLVGYFGLSGGSLRGDASGNVAGATNAGGMFGYYASPVAIDATTGTARASSVSGSGWAGGYVGYMGTTASITGITSAANVTATASGNAGGLAGRTAGSVSSSSASGTVVSGANSYAGGLVALAQGNGSFTDVSASGAVSATGNSYTGGLVGELGITGGILRGTASGNVTGGTRVGGLVGNYVSGGDVRNARATGNVTAEANAGGLIAVASGTGGLYDSSATGSVTTTDGNGSVGGLVGSMSLAGGAARVQADGNVSGGYYTGGLVGFSNGGALVDTLTRATTVAGGRAYAGGLVGYNESGAITNGTAGAAVTGANIAGGLVGRTGGAINNGRATGNVTAAGNAGGLAGEAYNTLTDASATGNVTGSSNVGGLVGVQGTGSIVRGSASGSASGGSNVGGLVGYFSTGAAGNIQDSSATGAVRGTSWVGGLVGQLYFAGSVTNSTASGAVNGNNASGAGGLIGYWSSSASITDSRATGNVFGSSYAGGLVGYGDGNTAITNSSAAGSVVGETYVGGLAGYLTSTDVTRGVATGQVQAVSTATVYAGGLVGLYSNSRTGGRIDGSRASGNVSGDSPGSRIGGLVGQVDAGGIGNSSASGRVTALDSQNTFSSGHSAGGLVGLYTGSGISDSSATGNVAGLYEAGGLAGRYNGTTALTNATASGTVSGTQYAGGLVGRITRGGISNGTASGDVTASATGAAAGGLVGEAAMSTGTALVTGSQASGDVTGARAAGGLVGSWNSSSATTAGITGSSASGDVTGSQAAGGLVGVYNGNNGAGETGIRNALASGTVRGVTSTGGLVGQYGGYGGIRDSGATGDVLSTGTSGAARYIGGLVGLYNNFSSNATAGQLTRSYASGKVSLDTPPATSFNFVYAGGLVGWLGGTSAASVTLTDAYATGAVTMTPATGSLRAGGLVGFTNTSMARVYATGAITVGGTASRLVGGLVAERNSTAIGATASFWATDTTGVGSSVLGTGRTAADLTSAATFTGWDIATTGGSSSVWRLYEGNAAPLLRGLLTPATVSLADMSKVYDGTASLGGAVVPSSTVPLAHPERIFVRGIAADAGSYALAASQVYSSQSGYDLTVTGNAQLTIDRRTLTLAGLVSNKVYDATTAATVAASPALGNLVAGEDLRFVPGAGFDVQFADKNAGTGKTVNISGTYGVADGVRGRAANYVLPTTTTTTADITRATLTGGSFAATSRVYDGSTTVAVRATSSALTGVLGSDSVSLDLSSVSSGTMVDKNVGSGKRVTVQGATLTGTDAGNYLLAGLDDVRVDITPRAAVVNGLTATNRQYNFGTTVSIDVSGMFLSNVVPGDQVDARNNGIFGTVADKNVARDANGVVTSKPVTVTGVALRGLDASNYAAQVAPLDVTITPRQVSISAFSTTGSDRVYDGTANAVAQLSQPWFGNDNVQATAASVTFADKNVAYNGSGAVIAKTITAGGITIAGTDAGNYALVNSTATTQGTISPRGLTVSGVVATDRVYDGTRDVAVNVASATVDTSNVVAGDSVAVTIPTSGTVTGQMADKNAGSNKAVSVPGLALTGTDRLNYTLNSANGGVTVNIARKDVRATYTAQDRVYDGNPWAIATASTTDFIVGDRVSFYTNNNPYYTGFTVFTDAVPKNVGTAKPVRIRFERLEDVDAANYNLLDAGQGTATASVTPKPVTLAFSGDTKVYDGLTAATVTLNRGASGVVGGDVLSTTQTAVFTGANAKDVVYDSFSQIAAKPISVSNIQLSGADAFNYTVGNTTATTTGRITPRPVTLSGITAVDRAYDGTTTVQVTASTVTSNGFVGSDNVAVVLPPAGLTTGTITDRNVGTAKPVTVTGLSLGGTDAGNYSIDIVGSGITVNIGRKLITPTYTGVARVYDGGVTAQVTASRADIVAGDTVTFTQQAIYTGSDAKNVGTAKPVAVSNIVLGGASQGNYQLAGTTATTTADITPKPVTASYTGLARVYNGLADRSVGVLGSSLQLINGDDVGFTQTAQLDGNGAAGTGKPVTVSNIGLSGADARNYTVVNATATTTATINPRPLGVTGASVTDRVYDGTTTVAVNVSNASVDLRSVIAGDEVVITLPANGQTTGTMADRFVGAAKPVSIGALGIAGASAANYTLEGATGLAVNITPRPLVATWTGVDKVYNGSTVAQVNGSSADIYAIDAGQVLLGATGTYTGAGAKNVGTGKDVTVSGGVLSGALRDNYLLVNPTGRTTASITPRAVTASYASGLTKVYDGTVDAPASGTLANVVSGDAVGLVQTAIYTGTGARNVGSSKPIAITGAALVGSDAGNYTLATTGYATTGGITPRPITVAGLESVIASDRVYDGTRTVTVTVPASVSLVPSSRDIVAGDDVVIAVPSSGVTTGRMADKNVGTGKAVNVDGLTLSGAEGGNYAIAGTAGITVNITPKPLTAVYSGLNRVYNATNTASAFGTSGDIIAGDSVTISGSGFFTGDGAKNVGTGKAVTVTQAALSGTDGRNYALLNPTGSTTADITPLLLTATFLGIDKIYDGTDLASVRSTTGFLAGDDVAVTSSGARYADKNVAYGAGNQVVAKTISLAGLALGGADAGNYGLRNTTATTTATIRPKSLRIDGLTGVTAASRVYDGTQRVDVTITSSGTLTPNAADLVGTDVVTVNAPPTGQTTGTLLDKNVGNNKPVTVTGLTLSGADAGNYSVTATSGITVNITPKSLTAVYAGRDKVYDGTAAATVIGTSGDIVAGDTVAIGGAGAYTGTGAKNVGTGKSIAVSGGRLTGTDAVNYTLLNPTGSATASITPRPVTAQYTGGSRVYDGSVLAPVLGEVAGAIAGDDLSLSASAVFTGAGAKNAGTGKAVSVTGITLAGADAGNYLLGSSVASTTATITPRPLRILGLAGVSAVDRVYDGTRTVVVNVTATGNLAPNPDDIVAGDTVTIAPLSAGATTGTMATKGVGANKAVEVNGLALGGADAANYSVAATSGVTVNITPRSLTAAYNGVTRVYDGTATAQVSGNSTDIVAGDAVTISGSGLFVGAGAKNVGTGKAIDVQGGRLAGVDAGNYALLNPTGTTTGSITPRTVNAVYTGLAKVYDGTVTATVSGSAGGFIAGDEVGLAQTAVYTGTGAKNVGTNKTVAVSGITLTGGDAANYSLAANTATTTGSITPRPLRINGLTGITANDRVYDGTTAVAITVQSVGPISANGSDIIAGDDVAVALPSSNLTAGTIADKNAGRSKPVTVAGFTLSGADAGNYQVAAAEGVTVNITPRPLTASYAGLSRVYDGTANAQVGGTSADIVAGDTVRIDGSGVFTGPGARNVGTGKEIAVTGGVLAGADAANYSLLNPTGTARADITPRLLTASYTGGLRVYDGTVAAPVTYAVAGLVDGDSLTLTQTAEFTGAGAKNAGTGKAVAISGITLAGADAGNYQLASTSASTTATITPRPLNVGGLQGLTAVDRVYDGTTRVDVVGSLDGIASVTVIPGDQVSAVLSNAAAGSAFMADKNAGTAKPVSVPGLTLTGADAANYRITGIVGLTVNIAPRPVVLLGISARNRVYDGTTTVAVDTARGSIEGTLAGDDLQLLASGVTGAMADKNVGNGKTVAVTGLALGGADAGNYVATNGSSLTVNIAPRTLLATVTAADKVYDGTTQATATLADDRIAGDQLALAAGTARFDGKDVASGRTVTIDGLSLSGADAGNYVLAAGATTTTASITRAPLTVTANSLSKVYGESVNLTGSEFTTLGLVAGESIGFVSLSSAGTAARADAGSYAIGAANASGGSFDAANYSIGYVAGQLRVTPRAITITADNVVRYAGEPNPGRFGWSVGGRGLAGDDTVAEVSLLAPAASAGASGGAIYELLPSRAVFGAGTVASNYVVSYGKGLLVVLPKPPLPNEGGGEVIGAVFDPEQVAQALKELDRSASVLNQAAGPGAGQRRAEAPRNAPEPSLAELAALLSGDGTRINLPALQRLPLISLDPQLRQLVQGTAPRNGTAAPATTP